MVFQAEKQRFLIPLITVGVLLSACGGDGASTAESNAATIGSEAVDQAGTNGTSGTPPPDDLAMVDDHELEAADAGQPFVGDPDSPWCVDMRAVGADSNPLAMDVFGLTPAEMELRFTETAEVFARMKTLAPADIGPSVAEATAVFEAFVTLGAQAGWDLDAMISDPEFIASFDLVGLESAVSEIERYTLEVCGVELG